MAQGLKPMQFPAGKCQQCDDRLAMVLVETKAVASHFARGGDGRGMIVVTRSEKRSLCRDCCPAHLKPAAGPDDATGTPAEAPRKR